LQQNQAPHSCRILQTDFAEHLSSTYLVYRRQRCANRRMWRAHHHSIMQCGKWSGGRAEEYDVVPRASVVSSAARLGGGYMRSIHVAVIAIPQLLVLSAVTGGAAAGGSAPTGRAALA
jgi:hypothetical protein